MIFRIKLKFIGNDLEEKYKYVNSNPPDLDLTYLDGCSLNTKDDYSEVLIPFCQFMRRLHRKVPKGFLLRYNGRTIINTKKDGKIFRYSDSYIYKRIIQFLREIAFKTTNLPAIDSCYRISMTSRKYIDAILVTPLDGYGILEPRITIKREDGFSRLLRIDIECFNKVSKKNKEVLRKSLVKNLRDLTENLRTIAWLSGLLTYNKNYPDIKIDLSDVTVCRSKSYSPMRILGRNYGNSHPYITIHFGPVDKEYTVNKIIDCSNRSFKKISDIPLYFDIK